MTREEARKAAEVMLAYAEGKEIEYSNAACGWGDISHPNFDWSDNEYRIKPQSKYRPFKNGKECWEEMLNHKPFGWIQDHGTGSFKMYILSVDHDGVMTANYDDGSIYRDFEALFKLILFPDGTPFGKLED